MKGLVKYLVDLLLFIDFLMMAACGVLLGFVIRVGRHAHGEKVFFGLHWQAGVDMHLYLALLTIVLVVIHVGCNWKRIVQLTKQPFRISGKSGF